MTKQYAVPYVNFSGRAREALEFYQKVLGGELRLDAWGKAEPAGPEDRISYGSLNVNGTTFVVGSDGHLTPWGALIRPLRRGRGQCRAS